MNRNVGKLAGYLPQMRVEPLVTALVLPRRIYLLDSVAEDGAKPMLNGDRVTKFAFDRVDARLRHVRPNAQDVRKVLDLDFAHLAFRAGE